jgi:hypothetical protein
MFNGGPSYDTGCGTVAGQRGHHDLDWSLMSVIGVHALLNTPEPEALRATLRDVFGWKTVDAGDGWLIFALPPAELAVHPAERSEHTLMLICDDIDATVAELRERGIEFLGEPEEYPYMAAITMLLPGGVEVVLYEPRHPLAI